MTPVGSSASASSLTCSLWPTSLMIRGSPSLGKTSSKLRISNSSLIHHRDCPDFHRITKIQLAYLAYLCKLTAENVAMSNLDDSSEYEVGVRILSFGSHHLFLSRCSAYNHSWTQFSGSCWRTASSNLWGMGSMHSSLAKKRLPMLLSRRFPHMVYLSVAIL